MAFGKARAFGNRNLGMSDEEWVMGGNTVRISTLLVEVWGSTGLGDLGILYLPTSLSPPGR